MSIEVLIADDHDIVRNGVTALLENWTDIDVVESVPNGHEALSRLRERAANIDVAILDISMPGIGGLEVASEIQKNGWACQSIILSVHTSELYVWRALRAGARGYISKESASEHLVKAIHAVYMGQYYFSPKVMDALVEGYLRDSSFTTGDPFARLKTQERQLLQLVMDGKSNSEIAQMLSLSIRTVQAYRNRIMRKMGAANLSVLVRLATMYGLAELN